MIHSSALRRITLCDEVERGGEGKDQSASNGHTAFLRPLDMIEMNIKYFI